MIKIIYTSSFSKALKKLHLNQKIALDEAVRHLQNNPLAGEQKLGKLAGVRVYKFKMLNQLTLLTYSFYEDKLILELIKIGPHENFYRDLESNKK